MTARFKKNRCPLEHSTIKAVIRRRALGAAAPQTPRLVLRGSQTQKLGGCRPPKPPACGWIGGRQPPNGGWGTTPGSSHRHYGKGGPPQVGAGSLSLCRFPWAPGRLSYPPGLILGSVFLAVSC